MEVKRNDRLAEVEKEHPSTRRSDWKAARRVTMAEAIRIARANFERVEAALAAEVKRDGSVPTVWEDS